MRVRAAIFDVDGTLIDSNQAHAQAWSDAFAAEGHTIPAEQVLPLVGMGGDKLLPALVRISKDSPAGKRLSERRSAIFSERFLPALQPFPGVAELLKRLHSAGLLIAVASSSEPDQLRGLLQRTGVPELFEEATSAGDARQSKPSPDILHAALRRCHAAPAEAVLTGDTAYDVQAGRDAGVRVIGVRCGGWSDEGLFGAIAIFDGPADLLAHLDQTPFASLARRAR
jgi:HAD superfamily hydrolase (TIGR01509 family)